MSFKKRILLSFSLLILSVFLTGCLRITADELYSLPEVSEDYLRLQAQINGILSEGAEFAPPTRGPNRQAVQLVDLNGTGTSEVVAFFTIPDESALLIYIFEFIDGDYSIASTIDGIGTEIESVRYIDMDGDGVVEIVVGWQMGTTLRYMDIYSISSDFHSQMIVNGVEYTEIDIFDMTNDGTDDVLIFKMPTQDASGISEIYSLMQDGEVVREEARLSGGIETISRIQAGRLSDNTHAIFVDSEGNFENGTLVTDVFAIQDGSYTNISLSAETGVSESTVRHRMASSDIKNDGKIKIPTMRLLVAQSETEYFAIDWYGFQISGVSRLELTTYHNNFDEWFLILPFDWRGKVSVRREDSVAGERTIIFSYVTDADKPHDDFLKIFKLSGDNALARATAGDRVLLMAEGNATYAFELLAPPNSFGLTFDETVIKESFRLIFSDWLAGRAA